MNCLTCFMQQPNEVNSLTLMYSEGNREGERLI